MDLLANGSLYLFISYFLYRCIRRFKRCPYAFGRFLALGLSYTGNTSDSEYGGNSKPVAGTCYGCHGKYGWKQVSSLLVSSRHRKLY